VEAVDSDGRTVLHCAVAMGGLSLVEELLRRGANVNAVIVVREREGVTRAPEE
jgi:ankyrin repeat protein